MSDERFLDNPIAYMRYVRQKTDEAYEGVNPSVVDYTPMLTTEFDDCCGILTFTDKNQPTHSVMWNSETKGIVYWQVDMKGWKLLGSANSYQQARNTARRKFEELAKVL